MRLSIFIFLLLLFISCNNSNRKNAQTQNTQEITDSPESEMIEPEAIPDTLLPGEVNFYQDVNFIYGITDNVFLSEYRLSEFISEITQEEYLEFYDERVKLPSGKIEKVDGLLTINTRKGPVIFRDQEQVGDMMFDYGYEGFIDSLNAHLLYVQLYEAYRNLLVDEITGQITAIDAYPYFSENYGQIMTVYEEIDPEHHNIIQFYEIQKHSPEYSIVPVITLWSDNVVEECFWISDEVYFKFIDQSYGKATFGDILQQYNKIHETNQ